MARKRKSTNMFADLEEEYNARESAAKDTGDKETKIETDASVEPSDSKDPSEQTEKEIKPEESPVDQEPTKPNEVVEEPQTVEPEISQPKTRPKSSKKATTPKVTGSKDTTADSLFEDATIEEKVPKTIYFDKSTDKAIHTIVKKTKLKYTNVVAKIVDAYLQEHGYLDD